MPKAHALIIDDNRMNIEVLRMLLNNVDISSHFVESPRAVDTALESVATVDVVFLDLEFPNENGFVLHKRLRADPRLTGKPIVAYSVHTSEIVRAQQEGFDGFLGKPLDARSFPGQVERILNGEGVWE